MEITRRFLYYDVENGNGRIYSKEYAEDIVKQFNNRKQEVGEDLMLGELGHPLRFEVSPIQASHVTKEIHLNEEKKCIEGTIKILENSLNGKKVKMIMKETGKKFDELFVVRPRGIGTINSKTKKIEDYQLISFDIIPKSEDSFKDCEL